MHCVYYHLYSKQSFPKKDKFCNIEISKIEKDNIIVYNPHPKVLNQSNLGSEQNLNFDK